uniref:Protein kinase domain-containing protein n=1 Tax=Amphiprion percula TaxID=161767 RepID=A0A3P8S663_AMPPE
MGKRFFSKFTHQQSFGIPSIDMAKNLSIRKGNTLGTCHLVEEILGEGSFGVVAKCRNTETQKSVAVKVNKGQEGVLQQAISEIAVLKRMRCLDRDICNVVQWDGFFFDKENICITFELLDMSLRDYMKEQDRGFTIGELKPILYQLATALASLHSIGITHMDLKPDNIMVDRSHQQLKVKLIDFGLARPVSALHQGDCMGTLFYCAPEMLLGAPFDESIDIWALGQVMAELAMGCWLYPGDTHYDMLRYIVETQALQPHKKHVHPSGGLFSVVSSVFSPCSREFSPGCSGFLSHHKNTN